jgi:hypothetical protein
MTFEAIFILLKTSTAIKLFKADNAPLVIGFFFKAFKQENRFSLPESEIVSLLDDYLYAVNQSELLYPKKAKDYLNDWTQDGMGFLRKFYETGDEPLYELTAATETALKWIEELNKPRFVGTDSRLRLLFKILRELSDKSKEDVQARIQKLENEKTRIEKEIEAAKNGFIAVFDGTQIKERYFNAEETANKLLSDFRQVEQNFRDIDKDFRRKIITTNKAKGKVLDELFQEQDYMWQTDQGKSFQAFWEFLMSQGKQEELEHLLKEVLNLPPVKEISGENTTISHIKNNLVEAGDRVNKSTGSLLEQLRKYVEHKAYFENKRIHDNLNNILKSLSEVKSGSVKNLLNMEIAGIFKLDFMMERPLYRPARKIKFTQTEPEEGKTQQNNQALYNQFSIDLEELKENIRTALKYKTQVTLKELVDQYQVQKGVAEIIGYVEIAAKDRNHLYNDAIEEEILIFNQKTDKTFRVKTPQIIYCR